MVKGIGLEGQIGAGRGDVEGGVGMTSDGDVGGIRVVGEAGDGDRADGGGEWVRETKELKGWGEMAVV